MLRQLATTIAVETRGRGLVEITRTLQTWVGASGFATGLLTLFIRHTSASLVVQENAAPEVRGDLDRFMARLVPDGDRGRELAQHRGEDTARAAARREGRVAVMACRDRMVPPGR